MQIKITLIKKANSTATTTIEIFKCYKNSTLSDAQNAENRISELLRFQIFLGEGGCPQTSLVEWSLGPIWWSQPPVTPSVAAYNLAIIEWGWVGYEKKRKIKESVIHRGRRPRWITLSEKCRILHILRKSNSIISLLFIQNIFSFFKEFRHYALCFSTHQIKHNLVSRFSRSTVQ